MILYLCEKFSSCRFISVYVSNILHHWPHVNDLVLEGLHIL